MAELPRSPGPRSRRTPPALRVLAVPVVVVIVTAGVWVTGGVVTDDMNLAMALTTVWFVLAGVIALLLVRARRDLLLPVLGAFVLAAGGIGGYLAYTSLVDREVHEQVAVGTPAGQARAGGAPAGNVQLASGDFQSGAHGTRGTAAVVELRGGRRVLTLTGFETSPGPDLRVYLSTDRGAGDFKDLGGLKGNVGEQQYDIASGVDLARYSTVVIWCRAFSVEFGSAALAAS